MKPASHLHAVAQTTEQYFLLRLGTPFHGAGLQIGGSPSWPETVRLPLRLLTTEMQNRTFVDVTSASTAVAATPPLETEFVLTLILSVVAGDVCGVLPGALSA